MLRYLPVILLFSCGAIAHAQTVVCFGDSLTFGTGALPGSAYPDFLEKDLTAAGYHATVLNQGVGGNTTTDGLARLPAVLAAHPKVVVLAFGANDAVAAVPVAAIEHNLGVMIETLQHAHVRVLLAGINIPRGEAPIYMKQHLPAGYLDQFYAIYPELAKQYSIPYIPFLLEGAYGVPGMMSPDYLHPDAAGYEKVALNVLPGVEQLLR
jgi:acyl-CoA thioesterase-1